MIEKIKFLEFMNIETGWENTKKDENAKVF
jgi:hypothetical protein